MSRKSARDAAMRLLYARVMGGEGDNELIEEMMGEDPAIGDDTEYIQDVLAGVQAHLDAIDARITALSRDWTIERMPRVDVSVLRLGAYEILYREDIPGAVSVNECVALAKQYSGPDAGVFVNGILGSLLRSEA